MSKKVETTKTEEREPRIERKEITLNSGSSLTETRRMAERTFCIPGEPRGKGRPRFARMGTFVRVYTPQETVSYENWVKFYYKEAARKGAWKMFEGTVPLCVEILCHFACPKSMSAKKRAGHRYVTKKPDVDNILKVTSDALNGLAWHDDSQIADARVCKLFTDGEPCTIVTITALVGGE